MLTDFLVVAIIFMVVTLILTVFWLLKASGLFTTIEIKIERPNFENLTLVYKFQRGDYSTSSDIFKDILNYSASHSTAGIYYDNPKDTAPEKRRFVVGMIVDEQKDREIIEKMVNENYQIFHLPKSVQSVCTKFPFGSVFSVAISTLRVPSRLSDFVEMNKLTAYPMVEIYLQTEIHYFLPLSDHLSYFVPETKDD